MIGMDSLFNQVPGCVITSGSVTGAPSKASQELNYACETNSGGTTLEQVPGTAYLDNPINDVAVEEPPMGSSNGIAQLELGRNQANTGIGTAFTTTSQQQVSAINYARSSRDPSSANDIQGLNFVAYAKDGVAPLIWAEASDAKLDVLQGRSGPRGLTTVATRGHLQRHGLRLGPARCHEERTDLRLLGPGGLGHAGDLQDVPGLRPLGVHRTRSTAPTPP